MTAALIRALALLLIAGATLSADAADRRVIDAAKHGRTADVRVLVQQHVSVNVREPDGTTALHWTVRADDVESTTLLLHAGASVNAANRYGVTPMALAALNGNPKMVTLLLGAGADPNAESPEGET